MTNSNDAELKNSVADIPAQGNMKEFVARAKAAILEEMANFDHLTQDMTPEEKSSIY